jgi:hypothetical protein
MKLKSDEYAAVNDARVVQRRPAVMKESGVIQPMLADATIPS